MPSITTKKLGYNNAKNWKDALSRSSLTDPVLYVYIGNNIPYANEASPSAIVDTISTEKQVWDNIFAAKKLTSNDAELVVPKSIWTIGAKYQQYDDTIDVTTLLSSNTSQNLKPMYVITSARNVYKCLSNNSNSSSVLEPTGDFSTSNGNIATADGYIWKYLYNIKPSNQFLTTEWMPAPTSTRQLDYGVNNIGVVEGELTTIVIGNGGSNYKDSTVTTLGFLKGCTTLTLANTSNVAQNMGVSGLGIYTGTYITTVDTPNSKITLSTATTANGGASGNNLTISTRVEIIGDGTGAIATPTLSNGQIQAITIATIGTGYTRANVFVYGSGSNVQSRVIVAPKFGHAYNPARELGASYFMTSIRMGEIDSTEGGLISSNTSYRQYGLLINPHKYGNSYPVTYTTANSVISQTTDLTLVAGPSYTLDEYVYQGNSPTDATFYARVVDQVSNKVYLSKVTGTIILGIQLVGTTSGTSRTVITEKKPEFQPYTGDIVYAENVLKKQRADGQAENIKFVVIF